MLVNLKEQTILYNSLLGLSEQKTKVITSNDTKQLIEILTKEEEVIVKIDGLEKNRLRIIEEFKKVLGLDELDSVLLKNYISPELYSKFDVLIKNFKIIINKLKNANDINSKLIENVIEYINFSVNVMTSDVGTTLSNSYGPSHFENDNNKAKQNLFDAKR